MKHKFTDTQLRQAVADYLEDAEVDLSISALGEFFWTQQVKSLRKMLDALPEPDDEWQVCTIDQIRKGDRVRWQDPGMEDTCTYEIIADHTEAEDPGWILFSRTESYYFPPGAVVDRIPAPVQHPDPLSDLAILVHGAYGRHFENPTAYISDGGAYNIVGLGDSRIYPHDINEWEPAKVVPKVVETND